MRFLFERQQQPDGSSPRNSLINNKTDPDSFGMQHDEVAYPILMASTVGPTDKAVYEQHIKRAAHYVVARGESHRVEWTVAVHNKVRVAVRHHGRVSHDPIRRQPDRAERLAAIVSRDGDRCVWCGAASVDLCRRRPTISSPASKAVRRGSRTRLRRAGGAMGSVVIPRRSTGSTNASAGVGTATRPRWEMRWTRCSR